MRDLETYIIEQDVKSFYSQYWKMHDYNEWLHGVYEDSSIDEDQYYLDKYEYDHTNWDIPYYSLWQSLIYERLGESFELTDKNIKTLTRVEGIKSIKILNSKIAKFIMTVDSDKFNENEFSTLMNFYGYALDSKLDNSYTYDAVKPKEINNNFKYVYHITHKSAYDKIKKFGLIPKQKKHHNQDKHNLSYPSRIYVWNPNVSKTEMLDFAHLSNRIHGRDRNDIIILKIAVQPYMKFYGDPAYNSPKAMFTMEPIQTKYITVVS